MAVAPLVVAWTTPFWSPLSYDLMPIMLLRRDVIVGFLGLSSASAAACTLLAPEWLWTGAVGVTGVTGAAGWGRARLVSGCECSDETVEAEAEGEPADLAMVLERVLVVGAAMVCVVCGW